jgi:uncharacterized protein (TIGR03437 family)
MSFAYTLGDASGAPAQMLMIGATPGSASISASVTSGNSWLSITGPASGTTPATFTISVNPTGLTAQTYNGNIQITSAGATNTPFNVPVSFVVSPSTLTVPATPVVFNYTIGSTAPPSQNVSIGGTPGIAFSTVVATVPAGGSWLSATPSGTVSASSSVTISINTAGLTTATTLTGSVTVNSTGATGSGAVIPVTVNVIAPVLTATPTPLTFNYQFGSATQPAAQQISVGDPSGVNFTATPATTSGGSWLSVTPGSGNATGSISAAVNTTGLAAGIYNGTVTVAATGAISQVVNVTLTVAQVTVGNPSLNFAFQIGGTTPPAQVVNIGGTSGLTFTATPATTSGGSWLLATPTSGPISSSSSISVSVNTAGLTANTYNGTITVSAPGAVSQQIAVTLTVSNSPTISASPSSLSFTYTLGSATQPVAQTVTVSGSGGLTITASAATSPAGGTWLSAAPVAPGTTPGSVSVSVNTTGLAAGTYNGTVTIGATGATSQPVTVMLVVVPTITATPSTLSFAYTLGSATQPASQPIAVGGTATTYTASASTNSGGSWLSVTPSGSVPSSASVSVNTTGLAANTYTGTITIASAGATSQMVTVTLVVSPTVTASPSTLSFAYTQGSATQPAAQLITVGGTAASYTASVTTTSGGSWLSVTASGTIPGSASVSVNTTGLTANTYKGTVTISATGAVSQTVTVTLVVSGTLSASPSTLSFAYTLGSSTQPAAQSIAVGGTAPSYTATASTNSGGSWLSVTASGAIPGNASVSVNTSGLTANTYTGTVTIAATGATSQMVTVTLVVSPTVTASPSTLSFTYALGSATQPAAQSITVGGTAANYTATAATNSGGSWLSVTASGAIPGNASVSVNTTGLAANTYTGTVTISAAGAVSQMVTVTLVVSATAITASPTSLSFTYTIGSGTQPAAQALNIGGASGVAYTAAAGATWLSVTSGASGALPSLLSISVTTAGLTAGTYQSSITVTAAGASNSPFAVPVTIKVNPGASIISVSPSALSFSATVAGSAPANQQVYVSASATTAVTISTIGGAWLGATISPGTTPAVVTVSANPANLTAGTYSGTVVVSAATASDSPQNVSVQLVVSPATIIATPGSLLLSSVSGSSTVATQSISVTSTGPLTFTTAVANGSWLTVTSSSTTTPSTLSISADSASLAPGNYTATIAITSPSATNSPLILPIAFEVSSKPKLAASPTSLSFTAQTGAANPASQSINVSGGTALPFSVSASPSWLSVSVGSSTTPSTLVVTVNSTGISPGSYMGAITVNSMGAGNTPVIIPVSFSVSAPLIATGPSISSIVSAASFASAGFSPGDIVTIFGSKMGPQTGAAFSLSSQGTVADTLGGVSVTVGGLPAIPLYAQDGQVNVILPFNLPTTGQANVQVGYNSQTSTQFNITLVPADVQIFTADASGKGPGSILNQDYSVNSASNGAAPGSVVSVYGTGGGVLIPPVIAGDVAGDTLAWIALQYSATVNGENATVVYAGSAPSLLYGVYQFNVQLPAGLPPGPATIVLTVGGSQSQQDVTVFVK